MPTFTFHNKYHRNAHHTISMSAFPDSASDPIASEKYPFLGIFHNTLSGNEKSNSFDWGTTFTVITANSAIWERFLSVYSTVNTNSGFWENNFSLYNTYNELSADWNSAYTIVSTNSSFWNRLYLNEVLKINESQENTKQKNFSILEIKPNDFSNIVLDLSGGQVSYYPISNTSNISGFVGAKRGGIYNLYVITNGTCNSAIKLNFNPDNFKFENTNSFSITGSWLRKFEFFSDGFYLHGKQNLFDANTSEEKDTYFQGNGIILNPNPAFMSNGDALNPINGIGIFGVYPYVAGEGIILKNTPFSKNFSFSFTTTNAQSAITPYGDIGSDDRIVLFNPTLTATNSTTLENVIPFFRCDFYGGVDIFTRAYGYISQLILNDNEIKDFVFKEDGYINHETGHRITNDIFPITANQTLFVKFGDPKPIELSGGLLLWLDAMDYSSVNFNLQNNFVTELSSKYLNNVSFSSVSASEIFYNTLPKQSINYNLSSTHYNDLLITGSGDFVSLTVLTPVASSSSIEWLWNNGEYGVFKVPYSYSLGVGNLTSFYIYNYGASNANKPLSIGTLYLSSSQTQSTWINGPLVNVGLPLTADFISGYTMIGGLTPLTGFSMFKLHENILYKGAKSLTEMDILNQYLLDKWKFL